jgi:hypothetical protein
MVVHNHHPVVVVLLLENGVEVEEVSVALVVAEGRHHDAEW